MEKFVKIKFSNKTNPWKKIKVFLKHRDPVKFAFYRREWNIAPKKDKTRNFPIHLGIEPTNACNLNCVFCARRLIDYKFGYMDFSLYKKIIDEGTKNKLRSVKLVRGGESLLHPQFTEMIKYAREKGIVDIMFNTNCTLLSPEKSLEIIKAGPDLVIFSVDAPDKEIYEKQRVGSNYEKVEKNIKAFIELKNKLNSHITTRAYMVYTDETEHLIEKHIERWKNLADDVAVNKACSHSQIQTNKDFRCRNPFRRLDITWDGKAYACDPDFDPQGKLFLGDANTQTIAEIWHSPKIKMLRNSFRQNKTPRIDPCMYCRGA